MYERGAITSLAELRKLVPEPNSKVRLKILDRLERHSQHMVALSSLVALSCDVEGVPPTLTLLTTRGALAPERDRADHVLRIDDADQALRRMWALEDGARRNVGGLVLVAGIPETLRLNGAARASADPGAVSFEVQEVFLQCPKAFVRSRLWDSGTWTRAPSALAGAAEEPVTSLTPAMRAFVERSPFAVVGTTGEDGRGDLSPRGDPVGSFVRVLDDGTLLLPDRTGNQLVDTLRNVLVHPTATAVFLLPGASEVLRVHARARITSDAELLAPSAVGGKAPKLGVLLDVQRAEVVSGALAELWRADLLVDPNDFPTMGEMILDQVNPGGKWLNAIGARVFDLGSSYHKRRRLY